MEVKINKEIRNYTESMFFGLSLRQFIFSVLACGVAVGLYFLLRPRLVDSSTLPSLISSTWKEEGKRKTGYPQQEEGRSL